MNRSQLAFDAVFIGTDVPHSIAAAALSKAGYNILHLDVNEYYGAEHASLSLTEAQEWAVQQQSAETPLSRYSSVSYHFPTSSNDATPPDDLRRESRQYSLSLTPSLITSSGPLIASLIKSGVSRYGSFRLLEGTALYTSAAETHHIQRVPSSKEDIFKDKSMPLIVKRKLMKFLQYAVGDFEASGELQQQDSLVFGDFLSSRFGLPSDMNAAITYAIAHATTDRAPIEPTLHRIRKYLTSAGRYGASPFLLGHYGGLGELAQGYCRLCAVHGGVYILGRPITSISTPAIPSTDSSATSAISKFSIEIPNVPDTLVTNVLIGSFASLSKVLGDVQSSSQGQDVIVRGIAVVQGKVTLPSIANTTVESLGEPDSFLVVFPPGSLEGQTTNKAVNVLVTGEGTAACPKGQSIVYMTTVVEPSSTVHSESTLKPYLTALLSDLPLDMVPSSLFELYYSERAATSCGLPVDSPEGVVLTYPIIETVAPLTEVGDRCAEEGERIFWEVVKMLEKKAGEEFLPTPSEMWKDEAQGTEDEAEEI